MSELKRLHINEVMDMHCLTREELGYSHVYYADDVDGVIEELKARIARLDDDNALLRKENAELREATRWRDIEKEPPEIKEESEEVAVLVEYENNYSKGVFVTHSDFYKGVFYETHLDNDIDCDNDIEGERYYQKVIKWQPMPKAPEVR